MSCDVFVVESGCLCLKWDLVCFVCFVLCGVIVTTHGVLGVSVCRSVVLVGVLWILP